MDEKPECSNDREPITKEDQSKIEKDLTAKEQSPTTTTEHPTHLEDQSITPTLVTVLTKDQPVFLRDQPAFSKEQPLFLKAQPLYSKEEPGYSKTQTVLKVNLPVVTKEEISFPAIIIASRKHESLSAEEQKEFLTIQIDSTKDESSKEQSPTTTIIEHPAYSEDQSTTPISLTILRKDQPVFATDQLAFSKEQPTFSYVQPAYSKDQPAFSKPQAVLTANELVVAKEEMGVLAIRTKLRKHESISTEEKKALSTIKIDSTNDESSSSKQRTSLTNIHMNLTTVTSKEIVIIPKKQIASTKVKSSESKEQKPLLKGAALTTKDEQVGPKYENVGSMTNCSKSNVEYAISLCAAKLVSGTPSYITNNGYLLSSNAPLRIDSATQSHSTTVPVQLSVSADPEPPTLFLQALSKLNESSLTLSVISHFRLQSSTNMSQVYSVHSGEITPPDSLSSAPPTYSFVLRQIAVRRRPRFMNTFYPSPSFVQHPPPPTYTGAFDVYIEPALPPPPARVYTFGFTSMPVICPECGFAGMTIIKCHVTYCTHMCAFLLCLLCCWVCAPLPYVLRSCKDVYHYCRNCRSFLGMYCPNYHEAGFPN